MAIKRERKEELAAISTAQLAKTDGFIVAEYKKLTVAQTNNLRRKLSESGGTYMVTKNTLFRRALQENGWPVPEEQLSGTVGIVFGNGNQPAVAKSVQAFIKDAPDNFGAKGGVISGSIFKASELDAVANLPTLDEIRAQIAGLIVTPASQLAGLLQAATSQIVNVLQAYEDKGNAA